MKHPTLAFSHRVKKLFYNLCLFFCSVYRVIINIFLNSIYNHIHSCWQHTIFVCHGTRYVYDIICIIYDVTHTVCMTTQALYLTWNPLKLPSHPLCMSLHPLCRRYLTSCVRPHRWHMYAIICVIHDIISTLYDYSHYYLWHHSTIFFTSHTLYMTSHLLCVMSHSLWVLHHTISLSVSSNTLCLWHIHLYGIMHSVMNTQPLCAFTSTMTDILFSVF